MLSCIVKGLRELNNTALWASADLRAYRKERNKFYLLKFWRAFPSEDPTATPHLKTAGRGQSVLWRGLRPELVRSNPIPLSPDANMLVTHNAPDWREQRDHVLEATRRLVQQVRSTRVKKRYRVCSVRLAMLLLRNTQLLLHTCHTQVKCCPLARLLSELVICIPYTSKNMQRVPQGKIRPNSNTNGR